MKKILLALLTLISVISYSQTTGYLRYDSVRIMKAGANSNLIIENATRDSLGFLYNYGNGRTRFEVIRAVPGGIKVGEDTIIVAGGTNQDGLVSGGSVTPEGGFRFSVQEATYVIEGIVYNSDSATVFVDSADATFDRFDVIYLDSDETVKVLEGIPAENPAIPQLPSGTILLTVVSIEAGAIQANVTTINVYFENDATITPSGTTAVGNSTAAPYAGTFHIRITTNNNGDYVDIIKTSGTWDISGQDFLSFHIKNRAVVPQLANWRASLWNGASTGSQVSGEVILNYNKNNATTYQAISIPMSAFGNITNTNIDRIRLRYTSNNATNHTGIDLDNIFFGDNLQQPGNGNFNATLNMPAAFTVSPTNTIQNNGIWNVTANGSTAQYIRGDGSLATFSAVTTVGAFGSQASQANGLFISGSNIYGQPVTSTNPGMTTPAMKASWDSVYTAENMSVLGDSIIVQIDAARTGFKALVEGANITITPTDSTLVISSSGGVGGGFFTSSSASATTLQNAQGENFELRGDGSATILFGTNDGGDNTQYLQFTDANNMRVGGTYLIGSAYTDYNSNAAIIQHSDAGIYQFDDLPDSAAAGTHHMVVWNATNDRLYKMDLPDGSGGGGGSSLLPVTGTGTATGNVIGDLDGNDFTILDAGAATYGGASHTFTSGGAPTLIMNGGSFSTLLAASDGTGAAVLTLDGDFVNDGDAFFSLLSEDGTNPPVEIRGDGVAGTITLTGAVSIVDGTEANGFVFTSDASGNGSWQAPGGGGANTALSNLAAVAINTSLISDADNTDDLGSSANAWKDIYARRLLLDGSTSGTPTLFSDALGNSLNSTTLSGTGFTPSTMYAVERSDFTGSNVNTVQPVFSTGNDVWTLQGSTTYEIEGFYYFTHGATAHALGISFELAGGASLTSIVYWAQAQVVAAGTVSSGQTSNLVLVATNSAMTVSAANGMEMVTFKGYITMNAGGTVTPSYTFSVAPGGTVLTKAGSYIKFTPIATNAATSLGNVN